MPKVEGNATGEFDNDTNDSSHQSPIVKKKNANDEDCERSDPTTAMTSESEGNISHNLPKLLSNNNTKAENYGRVVSHGNGDGEAVVVDAVAVAHPAATEAELSMASSEVSRRMAH